MAWEYKVVIRRIEAPQKFSWADKEFEGRTGAEVLNDLGQHGWELVSAVPIAHRIVLAPAGAIDGATNAIHYIFKRPS